MTHQPVSPAVQQLRQGLIVSCQLPEDSPLNDSRIIALMAQVAEKHGAKGVRINGTENIRAVRKSVSIAIVGIEKIKSDRTRVRITPDLASARRVLRAGSDIVAMDFTERARPGGQSLSNIVRVLRNDSRAVIMADVATLEQGVMAEKLGADIVATTLHGYTDPSQRPNGPAFRLLSQLASKLKIPVVLEGRVHSIEQARRAFDLGAYAVVVGTAITNMDYLVQQFVSVTGNRNSHKSSRTG